MDMSQSALSFVLRLSNLGIPGAWAFHIGSRVPLNSIRPATVEGDFSAAHSLASLEHSFSQAAALERYSEDNFDYYDENEEDIEYPPVEPGEALDGHSRTDVSCNSKSDPSPVKSGTLSSDPGQASLLPHHGDWSPYWETESASLGLQTKQGASVRQVEVLDFKDPVKLLDHMGTRTLAPLKADAAFLTPGMEDLGNRSSHPYPDAGPEPSEPDVPVPPLEGEVLPDYPVSGHVPTLGGRYVVGVEDRFSSNDQGKCIGKPNVSSFH